MTDDDESGLARVVLDLRREDVEAVPLRAPSRLAIAASPARFDFATSSAASTVEFATRVTAAGSLRVSHIRH